MLRSSAKTTMPDSAPDVKKPLTHEEIVEERLDLIVEYLHRAERRARWSTVGTSVRTFITLIPMLLFLGSLLYVYFNAASILRQIGSEAAKQSWQYSEQGANGLLDQFRSLLPSGARSSASSSRAR